MHIQYHPIIRFLFFLDLEDFKALCFQFGIEYDGDEVDDEGRTLYRIEVSANRIDLLSVEGIGRALKSFISNASPPRYELSPAVPRECIHVKSTVREIQLIKIYAPAGTPFVLLKSSMTRR